MSSFLSDVGWEREREGVRVRVWSGGVEVAEERGGGGGGVDKYLMFHALSTKKGHYTRVKKKNVLLAPVTILIVYDTFHCGLSPRSKATYYHLV